MGLGVPFTFGFASRTVRRYDPDLRHWEIVIRSPSVEVSLPPIGNGVRAGGALTARQAARDAQRRIEAGFAKAKADRDRQASGSSSRPRNSSR